MVWDRYTANLELALANMSVRRVSDAGVIAALASRISMEVLYLEVYHVCRVAERYWSALAM